jgi:hypothetical protein
MKYVRLISSDGYTVCLAGPVGPLTEELVRTLQLEEGAVEIGDSDGPCDDGPHEIPTDSDIAEYIQWWLEQ